MLRSIFFLLLVSTASGELVAREYVEPKYISGDGFKYPPKLQALGWEGWVYYSYKIGADGLVRDIKFYDSNGVEGLKDAVTTGLKSIRFEPAVLDGKPVEHYVPIARATFLLEGGPSGASDWFHKNFKNASRYIEKGKIDKAQGILNRMSEREGRSLYEELFLQRLLVDYHEENGDLDRAYLHALRVIDFYSEDEDAEQLPGESFIPYLVRAYQYEVERMMIGSARDSINWIKDIDSSAPILTRLEEHFNVVLSAVKEKEFWMQGALNIPLGGFEEGYWYALLERNEIELKNIDGEISDVILQCDGGQERLNHKRAHAWKIPESWGACAIALYGKPDTTFVIAELPDGSLQADTAD